MQRRARNVVQIELSDPLAALQAIALMLNLELHLPLRYEHPLVVPQFMHL